MEEKGLEECAVLWILLENDAAALAKAVAFSREAKSADSVVRRVEAASCEAFMAVCLEAFAPEVTTLAANVAFVRMERDELFVPPYDAISKGS